MSLKALMIGTAAVCLMAAPVRAADNMTLKFSHPFAATHKQWQQAGAVMAQKLAEDGGPEIRFETYPASQLGKEHSALIGAGLATAGILAPSYEPDKLPATSVAELPGMLSSSCEGTGKLWHLVKEGGLIDQIELKPLGVIALYVNATPAYSVLTSTRQVTKLEDVAGLKIRAAGAAMDRAARQIQAVPVSGTASELYDSISRGTIDGALISIEAVTALGLDGVLKYAFDGVKVGSAVTVGVMNRRAWDRLDAVQQDRLRTAGLQAQRHFCQWYDEAVAQAEKDLTEQGKLTITAVTPEENARWDAALAGAAQSWAADMDKSGRRGTEVLNAYLAAPAEF